MDTRNLLLAGLALAGLLGACRDPQQGEADEPRAGGTTTLDDRTSSAFSQPAPGLSDSELQRHRRGDAAFSATFVAPPAAVNPGLGPLFNHTSCGACHLRDGRGLAMFSTGQQGSPLLLRVSLPGRDATTGGPLAVPGLGTQLQDHATFGATAEVAPSLRWLEEEGHYGDGEAYALRRPRFDLQTPDGSPLSSELQTSARVPPPVFGLGLLEAIPESELLAHADPEDLDGDGISGRANYVWDAQSSRRVLGRFGWKANNPTLRQQAAGAYANDMGVTSTLFPGDGDEVELEDDVLDDTTFYTQSLGVPARAPHPSSERDRGEALFRSAGCVDCHRETLRTGQHRLAFLSEQTLHPYTDLLLHDLGEGLADGRPDFEASGTEWRTSPLWGLGLTQTVLPEATFLHDGRARTLAEAILWHGGEAEAARETFRNLSAPERAALLDFLRAL